MVSRRIVGVAVVALLMSGGVIAGPASGAPASKIPSSLVSVTQVASWSATRWGYEFRDWASAGIREVVLNGAVKDEGDAGLVAYYPSSLAAIRRASDGSGAPQDSVTPLLEGARGAGIRVWLGTYLPTSEWFSPTSSSVKAMTVANASRTSAVIADLDRAYASYSDVVAGWYLGSEVGANYAWSWTAGEALAAYYTQLVASAASATTASKTMISPYYNPAALPNSSLWTSMWKRILTAAPVDVLALQDGTGDCSDNVCGAWRTPAEMKDQLDTKFGATREAITAAGSRTALWANLDLYDSFGYSKPIRDLEDVHTIVAPHVDSYTSWSFTRQYSMWTLGTKSYHVPFALWNTSDAIVSGVPSTPTYLTTTTSLGLTTVTWEPSTVPDGATRAFYRIFDDRGRQLANSSSPRWTGTRECISIVAVDTSGNTSLPAENCTADELTGT